MDAPRALPRGTGSVANVIGQIRAERLRFALMRLSFAGVCLLCLLFLAWALPWVPLGMTTGDYTATTALTVILALTWSFASLAFLVAWAPHFRHESLPEFLRVLFGAQQLIRGRQQFYSRLTGECHRARRDRRNVFSLIVVQLPGTEADLPEWLEQPEQARHLAAMLVRSSVRSEDIVGDSWPHEVWVLSLGAGREALQSIIHRLAQALTGSDTPLPSAYACRIGGSTFGHDGMEPGMLFSAAYQRLTAITDLVEPASAA